MTKKDIINELDLLGIKATKATSHPDLEVMLADARKAQAKAVAEETEAEAKQNEAGEQPENDVPEADQTSDTASVVEGGSEEKETPPAGKNESPPVPPTPPVEIAPEMVTVKALAPIYEGSESYAVGDEFEVTTERAMALSDLVEILG